MPRPSHATVVAYAALFVALGGSAYAITVNPAASATVCASNKTGALRLAKPVKCGAGDRILHFYTKLESNARYAPASLFGNPIPTSPGIGSDPNCYVGEVLLFAGGSGVLPENWVIARGQAVATTSYPALFGLVGYTFGGAGPTFDLPNLAAADPKGDGEVGANYAICATGKVA